MADLPRLADPENLIRMATLEVTIVAGQEEITVDQSIAEELEEAWLSDHPGSQIRITGSEKVLWGKGAK